MSVPASLHARFAEEYLLDLNGEQAYVRTYGCSIESARSNFSRVLRRPEVQALIARGIAARSERTNITQDMVLQRWWAIATADPNEVVQYRRGCCRHCWGADHLRQWTPAEFTEAQRKHEHRRRVAENRGKTFDEPEPDPAGGLDYDRTRPPNEDCPECRGEGVGAAHIADTAQLAGAGRLLYAGVEEGRDGLKVKLRNQDQALEHVARHVGMFKDKGDTPVAINFTITSDDANL